MAIRQPTIRVLIDRFGFTEAPRADGDGFLVSDVNAGRILRVGVDGRIGVVGIVGGAAMGLARLPDGRVIAADTAARRLVSVEPDGPRPIVDLADRCAPALNDMIADAAGRLYVGPFGYDRRRAGATPRPAALLRVDPDGGVATAAEGLHFPNGMALSPDGRTLFVAETDAARLTAFAVDGAGGLSGRRTVAELPDDPPDGIALDAGGAVWLASPASGRLVRVAPDGAIRECLVPPLPPYACALGGPDGRHLLICGYDRPAGAAPAARLSGALMVVRVAVPAAVRPRPTAVPMPSPVGGGAE